MLEVHQGGGANPVASPTNDCVGVPERDHAHYGGRGQWWGPVLRLPKEVREDEEAQGNVEVWWGEEKEGKRTGVQFGCDRVRGLQEEDDRVAVSFRMTRG